MLFSYEVKKQRIALISDIHGNLSALDLVLEEIDKCGVDSVVCLGDASASGPFPRETLDRLRLKKIPTIMGNKDQLLLDGLPGISLENQDAIRVATDASRIRDIDKWCVSQLSEADRGYIRSFEKIFIISADNNSESGELLCFHGSPKSNRDLISSKTPDAELGKMLSGFSSQTMVGGHSHIQMLRRFGEITLINPGSVGQAIEKISGSDQVRRVPWSEYAIIAIDQDGFLTEMNFLRKRFDASYLHEEAMKSGMPHAEWWADRK